MNILKKNLSKIPGLKKLYFFYKIEREFKNFVNKQQHYNNHILIYKYKINSDSIDIFLNKADIRSYLVSLHKQDHKISLFKELSIKLSSSIFIDIGANYGEFSGILSSYFKTIFAIEPNPLVVTCLKKTLKKLNKNNNEIYVLQKACTSSKSDLIPFEIDTCYSGANHIIKDQKISKSLFANSKKYYIEVEKISLKKILEISKEKINQFDLENNISIKIDIEGGEYELLKELKSIDQRNELNFLKVLIMFEYDINYPSNHIEIIEITKYFIRKGYECIILPGSPEEFKKNGYKSVNIQNIDKSLLDSCEIFLINKL